MVERPRRAGDQGAFVANRELLWFFVATFAISWSFWVAIAVSGLGESLGVLAVIPGAFGPPLAALLVVWASGGLPRSWVRSVARVRASPRWYGVALALPVGIVAIGTIGLVATDTELVVGELPVRALVFVPTILFMALLGGGQEELGWRGFALPALEQRVRPWVAALGIGVVWALWHLPLFYVPGASQYGSPFTVYAVGVVGLSVVFTWLWNRSTSVAVATVLHGSYNASLVLYPIPVDRLQGAGSVALLVGGAAVWIVALLLLVSTRGALGYDPAD